VTLQPLDLAHCASCESPLQLHGTHDRPETRCRQCGATWTRAALVLARKVQGAREKAVASGRAKA
jgi:hypothetical protein